MIEQRRNSAPISQLTVVEMRRSPNRPRGASTLAAVLLVAVAAPSPARAEEAPLIAAAGDIACAPINSGYNGGAGTSVNCRQSDTASLLDQRPYAAVLPLGDLVNGQDVTLGSFLTSYEPTWGRFRAKTHPAIGNHEYDDKAGAAGYWDYWNGPGVYDGPAGPRGRGWYSYDVGAWRLISLNSNCGKVACGPASRQVRWLERELRRNTERCALAYFHHPRFSSGRFAYPNLTQNLWRALYRGGADVVLNGGDHIFERFGPQRPSGQLDRRRGVSQFTVGTGGWQLFPIASLAAHSRYLSNSSFGILAMRLGRDSFGWSFLSTPAGAPLDQGRLGCHNEIDLSRDTPRRRSG